MNTQQAVVRALREALLFGSIRKRLCANASTLRRLRWAPGHTLRCDIGSAIVQENPDVPDEQVRILDDDSMRVVRFGPRRTSR